MPAGRYRRCLHLAVVLAAAIARPAAAAPAPPPVGPFTIKPPDLNVPAGARRGTLRRIVQPFGPWVLICDENLVTRKRICNVTQTLVDATGGTVFSWSLAARQNGAPVFVIRLPAPYAGDRFVQIVFGRVKPIEAGVILQLCNAQTCLGYLTVDPRIQRQITTEAKVAVKVRIGPRVETFQTSLDGLEEAVASLR